MNRSAVITGLGPISAIGCGRQAFWEALVTGRHGFAPITLCDVARSPSRIGAEVEEFRLERYLENGRVLARFLPRPAQFALAAAKLALLDAGLDEDETERERIGVCVGTSVANLGEALKTRDAWLQSQTNMRPDKAFHLFNHSTACVLSSEFDFRGPMHTITTGCNSGLDALGLARSLLQSGTVDAMLVVGTDCELVPEVLASLNACNALATRYNDDPGRASRPFDSDRDGNVIGEGAAAVVLESESHAKARRAKCYSRIAGYQVASSGRHRKYSHDDPELDVEPCVRALRTTLQEAKLLPEQVELVNANGSSSVLYDRLEASALAETFGEAFPNLRVHSIKSMLGQHGAGSSALQVVAACLSIDRGVVPPTINHERPDPACGELRIVTKAEASHPNNVLIHCIGFGGFYYSCAALTAPSYSS